MGGKLESFEHFFKYSIKIRKIIYTVNIIEGMNCQFHQITKNKPAFTNDDPLRRPDAVFVLTKALVRSLPELGHNPQPTGADVRRPSSWLTPFPGFPGGVPQHSRLWRAYCGVPLGAR